MSLFSLLQLLNQDIPYNKTIMNFTIDFLKKEQIKEVIPFLSKLRIKIFKEYPYLYDGDLEYEKEYLNTYANSKNAFVISLSLNNRIIGACTAIPLLEEVDEFKTPLTKENYKIEELFYIGEIILEKEFRNCGKGKELMQTAITYIKNNYPKYKKIIICTVNRDNNSYPIPNEYKDLKYLWEKFNFKKLERPIAYFSWKEINETEESLKPMNFWITTV
ncbi:MAG: GNAT family N-acetyltransferase [Bacteroidales bacterium]